MADLGNLLSLRMSQFIVDTETRYGKLSHNEKQVVNSYFKKGKLMCC